MAINGKLLFISWVLILTNVKLEASDCNIMTIIWKMNYMYRKSHKYTAGNVSAWAIVLPKFQDVKQE